MRVTERYFTDNNRVQMVINQTDDEKIAYITLISGSGKLHIEANENTETLRQVIELLQFAVEQKDKQANDS